MAWLSKKPQLISEADKLLKAAEKAYKDEKDAFGLADILARLSEMHTRIGDLTIEIQKQKTELESILADMREIHDSAEDIRKEAEHTGNPQVMRDATKRALALKARFDRVSAKMKAFTKSNGEEHQLIEYERKLFQKIERLSTRMESLTEDAIQQNERALAQTIKMLERDLR
jgi:methyl-accepting chemotaxis protein